MSKQVKLREASKTEWHVTLNEGQVYPGDTNIQLGCLMRIADSTEKMASNYVAMQNELEAYKRYYANERARNATLRKSNNALRGYINRLKKSRS